MMWTCPVCDDLYDVDGYAEHGFQSLYFCECGAILDYRGGVIPVVRVNMYGLEDQGRGLFIRGSRVRSQGVVGYFQKVIDYLADRIFVLAGKCLDDQTLGNKELIRKLRGCLWRLEGKTRKFGRYGADKLDTSEVEFLDLPLDRTVCPQRPEPPEPDALESVVKAIRILRDSAAEYTASFRALAKREVLTCDLLKRLEAQIPDKDWIRNLERRIKQLEGWMKARSSGEQCICQGLTIPPGERCQICGGSNG